MITRYDEYISEIQKKQKEDQVIVNRILDILKDNNLTVEHIEVILNTAHEEVLKKAVL